MAVKTYKCPNCDAGLVFDPGTQKFACEYCMSSYTEEQLESIQKDIEPDVEAQPADHGQEAYTGDYEEVKEKSGSGESHMAVYTCPSCGGEIIADETTAATFCYYCHNPVVLSERLDGKYMPDKVVPFTVKKEEAVEGLMKWIGKKRFIPGDFYNKNQIGKISGVYFPCWVLDCDADAFMEGDATKTRVWRTGDTEYTETKYYRVRREGVAHFKEIKRNALRKESNKFWENVQPFDLSQAKKFKEGYLLGFQAEKRNVEYEELISDVEQQMRKETEDMMRKTASGYQTFKSREMNIQTRESKWSYMLLPVWILTYKGRGGKEYYYAMNGQTGAIYGELPVDNRKLGILSGCIGAAVFLLLALML